MIRMNMSHVVRPHLTDYLDGSLAVLSHAEFDLPGKLKHSEEVIDMVEPEWNGNN